MESPKETFSPIFQQICASSVGGFISTTTLNPMNVMKTRLQASIGTDQARLSQIFGDVIRTKGVRGFWDGAGISILQSIPSITLYMLCYEHFKKRFSSNNQLPESISPGVAAGLARIITVSVMSPLELVRTVKSSGSFLSPINIARDIVKTQGFFGLYRGWKGCLLRDTPYSVLYWYSFENLRPLFEICQSEMLHVPVAEESQSNLTKHTRKHYSNSINFISGAMSGFLAASITHPFDVVKTQHELSASSAKCKCSGSTFKHITCPSKSVTSSLIFILREGGVRALYRGLGFRLFTVIPSGGIMITTYEAVFKFLKIEVQPEFNLPEEAE